MSATPRPELTSEQLVKDYVAYKTQRLRGRSIANANWVTSLAHECEAYAVYMRTVPAEKRIVQKDSLGMIFSEGDDQARAIKRDLLDMGYEVEGAEGQLAWPKYEITGRRDLIIRKAGMKGVDAELKSCSPFTYEALNTVEDVREHKFSFIRKWYAQVALYMLLKGVDRYWMILKNKSSGQIKILEFRMDDTALETAECMVKKAERVNKLVKIGELPSESTKISAPDLCPECEFYAECNPAIDFGIGATVLDEEEALEREKQLERRAELEPFAKEYEELDKSLKALAKAIAAPNEAATVVIGDWVANLTYQTVRPEKEPRKGFTKTIVKFLKLFREGKFDEK